MAFLAAVATADPQDVRNYIILRSISLYMCVPKLFKRSLSRVTISNLQTYIKKSNSKNKNQTYAR